jgi:NTE family protein
VTTAFVLGGGGLLGACEAGMARALLESGITPDLVVGTSIGAINGAAIASDPTPDGALRLVQMWDALSDDEVLGGSLFGRLGALIRTRTSLHSHDELAALLRRHIAAERIEDLTVPFECVAASVERAQEHWFTTGELVPAVLASCALPGVFPAVLIDGEHYLDGGLVNSIPIARAIRGGATDVWVLHVGRIEEPLVAPRLPWEVAFVAFEIARRHRFNNDLAQVPEGINVHVLPTGLGERRPSTWGNLRYRDRRRIGERADIAYRASLDYLRDPGRTA